MGKDVRAEAEAISSGDVGKGEEAQKEAAPVAGVKGRGGRVPRLTRDSIRLTSFTCCGHLKQKNPLK